jgi:hypothetical protein
MYSYAQCTLQKGSVCCRDVPCLAHMEHGPGPSTLGTYPPPYQPWYWGLSLLAAINKDGPGQWSGHLQAAQPSTCGPRKCMFDIVLCFRPVICPLECLSSDYLHSTDYCYIFRLINHTTWNKWNSPRAFFTFSWAALRTVTDRIIICTVTVTHLLPLLHGYCNCFTVPGSIPTALEDIKGQKSAHFLVSRVSCLC